MGGSSLAPWVRMVSAAEAVELVRQAAHELILSPRYLDYQIWVSTKIHGVKVADIDG